MCKRRSDYYVYYVCVRVYTGFPYIHLALCNHKRTPVCITLGTGHEILRPTRSAHNGIKHRLVFWNW